MIEIEDRILDGARELFFRHGMRSVTMDDIAAHLGISKKTIYQCYTDKDELVHELTVLELKQQDNDMEAIRKNAHDPIHEILLLLSSLSNMMSKMSPVVVYDLQKYHQRSWKRFQEFKERNILQFLDENMKSGIKSGLYRKEIEVKILARLRMEEVELGYNPVVYPPTKFNILQFQIALLDHFLHGIVTIKGHKLINRYKQIQEEE
ncbi:MAG: helix-turn-helix domain-containing protein [Bacteroidota bacterium]